MSSSPDNKPLNTDKFAKAGEAFQNKQARDFSARDQAIARLLEMKTVSKDGISTFYKAAGRGTPDVYVDMPNEQQTRIAYGFRPSPENTVVRGPFAILFATPDDRILLGTDINWVNPEAGTARMQSTPLRSEDWQDHLSEWLISFPNQSEGLYTDIYC